MIGSCQEMYVRSLYEYMCTKPLTPKMALNRPQPSNIRNGVTAQVTCVSISISTKIVRRSPPFSLGGFWEKQVGVFPDNEK